MVGLLDSLIGTKTATTTPSVAPSDMEQLQAALGGDWAKGLSSADKLAAVGALLKSVSRGSSTTPQKVMEDLQKQKLQDVQGRIQLKQLQTAADQAAKTKQAVSNYAASLPADQRKVFLDLPEKEQIDLLTKNFGGDGTSAMKNYNWVLGGATPQERQQRYQFVQAQNPQYLGSAGTGYQVVQPQVPGFITGSTAKVGDQKWVMGSANTPVKAYYVNGVDGPGWYDNPEGK